MKRIFNMSQNTPSSILVVEDDLGIVDMLVACLTEAGYHLMTAQSVAQAWTLLDTEKPDLILLDWMLPDEDGAVFFRQLRVHQEFRDLPVIMLTARSTGADQAYLLDQGVEDFIGKPFSQEALLARIRSVLRRTAISSELKLGDLVFNSKKRQVCRGDNCQLLFPREAQLLAVFMRKPGRVFSREDLIACINTAGQVVEVRTTDVHVGRLRKALKCIGSYPITTVRGIGYMFQASE